MELSSSDKERIQHQYDALAKKTLVGEAKSHRRTLAKRAAREVTFSDLSESELAQLFTTDEYESDYFRFQVSGFVRCADCKKAMRRKTARDIAYYSCRSYTDKKICSKHSIRQDKLENAVLAALQMQIALVDRLAEEIERINNAPVINRESKRLSHSLKQAEKQLKQYNDASDSLYLDWKSGEITKEEYRRLKGKIAEQIQQLEANISYLKEEMQVMADGIGTDDPYLTAFLKYKNIQSLNRGIMVELVKAVWVHENGEITVDFNFADEYQRIIDYIENNHNVIRVIENKAI